MARSIESLLRQSFGDYELIISDNASDDETSDICQAYKNADPRIRYFRQSNNIGLTANHNFTLRQAAGELFKWVAADDLYAKDLLRECVAALDRHPDVVLAHCWTATVDPFDRFMAAQNYALATSSPSAVERFRSMLFDVGGDDDYGVIRTSVLRRIAPKNSYHNADRVIVTALALQGQFYQIPDWLYFRREHPGQAGGGAKNMRQRCANMDPRRANPLLHPGVRLYGEYILGYVNAIRHAPLSRAERRACLSILARYLTSRVTGHTPDTYINERLAIMPITIDVASLVAGLENAHEA